MAYNFQLILKHILAQGVAWAPQQEIVYRENFRYTYETMYRRVLRLGGALQALGVNQGARVGVIERDSHRYLEMYFGIPGIGAVLHTINPRLSPEDAVYTATHAEDYALVFHEEFLPLAERIRAAVPSIRKYVIIADDSSEPKIKWVDKEYEEFLAGATPLPELPDLNENILATQFYTTGTTGLPKGVYFTQRQLTVHTITVGLTLSALANYGGLDKHDVYMPLTPMFHVHAWGLPYVATLLGLKQVYPGKYEPATLLRLITEEKVTFSHCVTTVLQMIVTYAATKGFDLSRWKVLIGGGRLPQGVAMDASKLGIKVFAAYGLSETCPFATVANLKPFMEEWDQQKQLEYAIKTGFVIPLVYVKVIDEAGNEVEHNGKAPGEIVMRAPWLTQGYYKEPELSKELWAGGWMHTKDVANIDEYGYLQIVDRLKDVIKSGGEWIASLELENLLSLHEGVLETAVIGIPSQKWEERPLAIVVPRKEHKGKLTSDMLSAHLMKFVEKGVINKWAVPDEYVFVDELPKTGVGKIDKRVLRARYATPKPNR